VDGSLDAVPGTHDRSVVSGEVRTVIVAMIRISVFQGIRAREEHVREQAPGGLRVPRFTTW